MPWQALDEIAKVFTWAAACKYPPRNYQIGFPWSAPFDACIRHGKAWFENRCELDEESGLYTLAHMGCSLLMLFDNYLAGVGQDDRPVPREKQVTIPDAKTLAQAIEDYEAIKKK